MKHQHKFRAFTLTECLLVLAIICTLLGLLAPVFGSLRSSANISQAASEVSSLLQSARSYARANSTYVWVGLSGENDQLLISVIASNDGSKALPSANPAQLSQINKLITLDNLQMAVLAPGNPAGKGFDARPTPRAEHQVGADSFPKTLTFEYPIGSGAAAEHRFSKIIQFTPRGEVTVDQEIPSVIEIGLQPTHGSIATDGASRNIVAIQCSGIAGNTSIYRP